jgi:hypothetical protein
MPPKCAKVVCTSCEQVVPIDQSVLIWEDPDGEADEYICDRCSDSDIFGIALGNNITIDDIDDNGLFSSADDLL